MFESFQVGIPFQPGRKGDKIVGIRFEKYSDCGSIKVLENGSVIQDGIIQENDGY